MNIEHFISKIEHEIEEVAPGRLTPETHFRSLEEWSSMHALILIALIDSEYQVTITGEDLRSSQTISDLFNIIKSRR